MSIVGGLDIHRRQITFEYMDEATAQGRRGRIVGADRRRVREWLAKELNGSPAAFALEGCTGWRYVAEELTAAGVEVHLADPAEVQNKRGRKKRAKTDRTDAALLAQLLAKGDLPESWVPPEHVLEVRTLVRLYKALVDTRTAWQQRMQAVIFHQGLPELRRLADPEARAFLLGPEAELSPAGRRQIDVGYQMVDALNAQLVPLRDELSCYASHQVGCLALVANHFGIGPLIAAAVWSELGDCRRFANSTAVVRHTGLDISVHSSDDHRGGGHLTRQGPGVLRWALYEAGKCGSRQGSPDYQYYQAVKARHDGRLATLSVARKLARRCYHTLYNLGDAALAPAA